MVFADFLTKDTITQQDNHYQAITLSLFAKKLLF